MYNIYKNPYKWYEIFKRIKYFFGSISCAIQRIKRGYSYRDLWGLHDFYTQLFVNSLRDLNKNRCGHPILTITNDYNLYSNMYGDKDDKEWGNILEDMALHFENSLEDGPNQPENEYLYEAVIKPLEDGYSILSNFDGDPIQDKYYKREEEIYRWRMQEFDKGFELLHKFFFDLWD